MMSSITNLSDLTIDSESRQLSELSGDDKDESFFFSTESQHNIMSSLGDMAGSESCFPSLHLTAGRVCSAPIARNSLAEKSFAFGADNESSLRLSSFEFSSANFDMRSGSLRDSFYEEFPEERPFMESSGSSIFATSPKNRGVSSPRKPVRKTTFGDLSKLASLKEVPSPPLSPVPQVNDTGGFKFLLSEGPKGGDSPRLPLRNASESSIIFFTD
jgi:hypothetical protein